MKKGRKLSLLSLLLALLMLGGSFVALPAAAVSLNEDAETMDDILWELEFDKMADALDNLGSTEYTLTKTPGVDLYEMDGQKCLGIKESNGNYVIEDVGTVLKDYEAYYIEADMYFESYPSGEAGGRTPRVYPMSFMTWITHNGGSGDPSYGSIRIDDEGYLCTAAKEGTRLSDSAKLPLNEWFNIRFVVSPAHKRCEVFVNHESVGSYSLAMKRRDSIIDSRVRFFDTRYEYSVYFKNISVTSDSDYRIGLTKEASADYLGYQTTKIENGSFDIRFLSAMSSMDYHTAGYTVYRLTDNGENLITLEDVVTSKKVYESVNQTAAGGTSAVKASDFGAKYLSAIAVEDFDADQNAYIVVRPWVMLYGVKTYGVPQKLLYSGAVKDGYPVLTVADFASQYELSASDDTYVGGKWQNSSDLSIHGSETVLDVKNSANSYTSNYTRHTYVKFTIPEKAMDIIGSAYRIKLEFHARDGAATPAETALGGIAAKISAVNTNWTEDDLTKGNAAEKAAVICEIGEMRYLKGGWHGIDVTEYVQEYFLDEEIAFRMENVLTDDARECTFHSKEAEDGIYAPRLVIYPTNLSLNYEVALNKIENTGHEPWGYVEQLVDEWFENDYEKLYMDTYDSLDLAEIDNNTANGEYSVYNPLVSSSKNYSYVRTMDTLEGYQMTEKTQFDEYGGITNLGVKGRATGYFHTETIGGKTYIIDPNGNPYYAMGANSANIGSTSNQIQASIDKYGSEEGFYKGLSTELMRDFGLNTVTGVDEMSSRIFGQNGISYIVSLSGISGYMGSLGLSISTGGSSEFLYNNTMNVFDPDFPLYVDETIGAKASLYANDSGLLGYTCDNEIPGTADYLERYLNLDHSEPVNAFSYAAAWTWLCRKTEKVNPSPDDVTPEMNQEFLAFVYNTYFKIISSTIEKYDPNHMYIGNRSNTPKQEGYLRAAGQYLDVFTVNLYGGQNYKSINQTIELMHKYTGLPFIVTEFGVRAKDAVDMNGYTLGNFHDTACWLVETQQQRANSYESYVLNLLESNNCVGWLLYRFRDNDQTLYGDEAGNVYLLSSDRDAEVVTYTNAVTGEKVTGDKVTVTKIYKGETDTTNLCHNKGIYDNKMEPYAELMASMKRVSDNLVGLIDHFAK